MKTIKRLLISVSLLASVMAHSQEISARDILEKHIEAMGGRQLWKDLRTYEMHQERPSGRTVISYAKKPDMFKLIFIRDGKKFIKSYDGKEGWIQRQGEYEAMRPGEEIEMAEEPEYYEELILAEEQGYTLQYRGKEILNDVETYKLVMLKSEKDKQAYWINTDTYLIEMTGEYSEDSAHEGVYFKTTFDDYRKVDGYLFPFKMRIIPGDRDPIEMTYTLIKVNEPISDSIFRMKQ